MTTEGEAVAITNMRGTGPTVAGFTVGKGDQKARDAGSFWKLRVALS